MPGGTQHATDIFLEPVRHVNPSIDTIHPRFEIPEYISLKTKQIVRDVGISDDDR